MRLMETWRIQNTDELLPIVAAVLELVSKRCEGQRKDDAVVLALHGDLGSGKTTFMQVLARELGITETVVSPTFVVMKHYALPEPMHHMTDLYHLDAYRIEDAEEMKPLRFSELLTEPKVLIAIEWAEHIETLLPPHALHLSFVIDGDERVLTLTQ